MNELTTRGTFGVTKHAIRRAVERLGVEPSNAVSYLNSLMQTAVLEKTEKSEEGRTIRKYFHIKSDTRIVVNGSRIVTVYQTKNQLPIDTGFLRPVLEREKRKLKRMYTRQIRNRELVYAEALRNLADMAINRARARNPHTRELIAKRMENKQAEIDGLVREIERLQDDWQAKVRAIEVIAE